RLAHSGALSARRAPGELRQQAIPCRTWLRGQSMLDKVDVLIIGSGASGAAVAWSLAETKMRILCLEQGDWVKPSDYPSNGRDWEARLFSDFAISPNRR